LNFSHKGLFGALIYFLLNYKTDGIHQIYRTTILYSTAYKIWVDKNFLDKNQRLNNTLILN
jgi:hypothetical protein